MTDVTDLIAAAFPSLKEWERASEEQWTAIVLEARGNLRAIGLNVDVRSKAMTLALRFEVARLCQVKGAPPAMST